MKKPQPIPACLEHEKKLIEDALRAVNDLSVWFTSEDDPRMYPVNRVWNTLSNILDGKME